MADAPNDFFSGLKKWIFKDAAQEIVPSQNHLDNTAQDLPQQNTVAPTIESKEAPSSPADVESVSKKAYEMLSSINQPGIDFMEVWNAAEENGGVNASSLKMAFKTLTFADKALSKEKVLETGAYYKSALQKALDEDVAKKQNELKQLQTQKESTGQSLKQTVEQTQKQITELQQLLTEKTKELNQLNDNFEPRMKAIEQRITTGQQAIGSVIKKMDGVIQIIQKEL